MPLENPKVKYTFKQDAFDTNGEIIGPGGRPVYHLEDEGREHKLHALKPYVSAFPRWHSSQGRPSAIGSFFAAIDSTQVDSADASRSPSTSRAWMARDLRMCTGDMCPMAHD